MFLGRLQRFCDVFSCLTLTSQTRGCQFQAAKNAAVKEGKVA